MPGSTSFPDLPTLATHLRDELQTKKFVFLYAYNGTGKTRLSTEFKNLGKKVNANGETTAPYAIWKVSGGAITVVEADVSP